MTFSRTDYESEIEGEKKIKIFWPSLSCITFQHYTATKFSLHFTSFSLHSQIFYYNNNTKFLNHKQPQISWWNGVSVVLDFHALSFSPQKKKKGSDLSLIYIKPEEQCEWWHPWFHHAHGRPHAWSMLQSSLSKPIELPIA